ncbi:hypothetical protein EV401DRAFT_1963372 [Pisolithus croceorrhizus]|nr:hypothetical protein EV401DRAFT_1963372 [Pisolithus croceorrhizus]
MPVQGSISVTTDNVEEVLSLPAPERLTQGLKKVFSKLLEPGQNIRFLREYTTAIERRLKRDPSFAGQGLDDFGKACVSAGMVMTVAGFVSRPQPPTVHFREYQLAQQNALASLYHICVGCDSTERITVAEQILTGGVTARLMPILDHDNWDLRSLSACILITLAADTAYVGCLTIATRGEIAVCLCCVVLRDLERIGDRIENHPTKMLGAVDINEFHAPLAHQQHVLRGVGDFLKPHPPHAVRPRLELLKAKPEVLDYLFDCATMPGLPGYPLSAANAAASDVLAKLVEWPPYLVPGVSTPMDSALKAREWKALSQCLTIVTSREEWMEKVVEVWMNMVEQTHQDIKAMFEEHLEGPPLDEAVESVCQHRGTIRVSALRIIINLTHAAESCGISNADIESFLHIAYAASRKVPSREECQTRDDHLMFVERGAAHGESILGPIALTRLLVVLAQRKALNGIQGLQKPPNGLSSSTCLNHVQHITNPDVIRRFLLIALERVKANTSVGRDRATEAQYDSALPAFTTSAELAVALVAFDTHTQGQYSNEIVGARRELVIALGNASEMALRQKVYLVALSFAYGAVSAAETIPDGEGLDPSIIEKNKRRILQAEEGTRNVYEGSRT